MRWMTWSSHSTRTFWALMVMPRSRSMSIESRYCSRMSRASTAWVSSRMRSLSVDLPWSMWAMIEMFRIRSMGWLWGAGALVTTAPLSRMKGRCQALPRRSGSVTGGWVDQPEERLAGGEAAHVLTDAAGQRATGHLDG